MFYSAVTYSAAWRTDRGQHILAFVEQLSKNVDTAGGRTQAILKSSQTVAPKARNGIIQATVVSGPEACLANRAKPGLRPC